MSDLKSGNLRELWKIAYPMMITFMSMSLMMFSDRLFLSWYSTDALNAAVQAGTLSWGIIIMWLTMASMSEVFVAQFNGSKQFSNIGRPVWQAIWICVISTLFFIPMAIWFPPFIYSAPKDLMSLQFLRYLLFFGPFIAVVPGIGGFFVGRGKTKVMQNMAILGNVINIVLDPIFIFGFGFIPQMGIIGAAVATGIGNIVQAGVLFYLFFHKKNKTNFRVSDCKLYPSLMLKTLKVGLPPSLFVGLEITGWAIFYWMMAQVSEMHIFVTGICQTIFILFMFFGMGLEKGAIAVVGNLIGAKLNDKVPNVFRSGLKLVTIFIACLSIFLVIFPDPLINWFFFHPGAETKDIVMTGARLAEAKLFIRIGMIFLLVQMLFENVRWVLNGILTAAGDTMFLLIIGVVSIWGFLLAPTYFFVVLPKASLYVALSLWVFYSATSSILMYLRYRSGKWKTKNLIKEDAPTNEPSAVR